MGKQQYRLRFSIAEATKGDIITFDPEWNEWTLNGFTYNFRGSIFEGEVTMLLNYSRDNTPTLLEPWHQEEPNDKPQ